MHAVAKGVDVLPLPRVAQSPRAANASDLGLKGEQLPVRGRGAVQGLVRRARRDDFEAADVRKQARHELCATKLDPAPLGVRYQNHSAMLLREAQRLAGGRRHLGELPALGVADDTVHLQGEVLQVEPSGWEHRVIPIENEKGLFPREVLGGRGGGVDGGRCVRVVVRQLAALGARGGGRCLVTGIILVAFRNNSTISTGLLP
mmetsp:Transcript_101843/g.199748  ORF Transcript_101843/g.199748 Transcript_101843/m.199748 type:complete len:203 (-) Transcript_101843:128-736(-)